MARIFGQIKDKTTGAPIPDAYVEIKAPLGAALASATSDGSGSYSFLVPWQSSFTVAATVWVDKARYRVLRYIPGTADISTGDASEVRRDLSLRPAGNLVLQAYTESGTLVRRAAFVTLTGDYAHATDLNDIPVFGSAASGAQEYSPENGWDWDLAMPAFALAPDTLIRLHVLWEIPSFGKVIVDLDNLGKGYTVPAQGDYITLNLNREAAASEVARLKREIDDAIKAGYELSSGITAGHSSAQAALQQGDTLLGASPADMTKTVAAFNMALGGALAAQEDLRLERAQADIPKYRKGRLRLQVRQPDGTPSVGLTVTYSQQTHDFQFGASYLRDWSGYVPVIADTISAAGFNASGVSMDYMRLEPQPGQYDWTFIDVYGRLDTMIGKGFRVHGELAYWAIGDLSYGGMECPDYWRTMSFDTMAHNLYDHYQAVASRYGSQVSAWEINEQNVQNCLALTWPQKMAVHDAVMNGLRAGDPAAQNIVNAVAMPYGWSQEPLDDPSTSTAGVSLPVYLNMLVNGKHAVNNIGLEFYHFGVGAYSPYGWPPGLSLAAMARLLDLYSGYQVPVYVKEFQVPSTQEDGSCWWRRPWDPQTQAEFAEKFYTIAFSGPGIHGIQWSADVTDLTSCMKNAGLLDAAYQPKPVYYRLKNLIASWTTSGTTTTDAQGLAEIVGFAGDYAVQLTAPGAAPQDLKTHVYEQQDTVAPVTYQGLPAVSSVSAAEPGTLPESLLGTTVQIRDAKGAEHAVPLFAVSPGQVVARPIDLGGGLVRLRGDLGLQTGRVTVARSGH